MDDDRIELPPVIDIAVGRQKDGQLFVQLLCRPEGSGVRQCRFVLSDEAARKFGKAICASADSPQAPPVVH